MQRRDRSFTALPTLYSRALDALEETIFWHAVGISLGDDQGIGSGTGIQWRKRKFIVTARHNFRLEGRSDVNLRDVGFFLRELPTIERSAPSETLKRGAISPRQMLPFSAVHLSRTEDLAAIDVDGFSSQWENLRFYQLKSKSKTPARATIGLMGWPASTSIHLGLGMKAVFPRPEWTRILTSDESFVLERYDPRHHFLAKWSSAESEVDPQGMSGACFWQKRAVAVSKVWSPTQLRPVGVFTHYYRKSNLLKAVKIERAIQFFEEICDLSPTVETLWQHSRPLG